MAGRHSALVRSLASAALLWVGAGSGLAAGAGERQTAAPPGTQVAKAPEAVPAPAAPAMDVSDAAIVRKWGIRIESMRLTAAGYMLDFRYLVVDARKAKPLFERKTKPLLTDEATGAQMKVPVPPKTGALRNSNEPKAGRQYFMFFANPGRFIKPGSLVTVTIGDFRISGIRVDTEAAPGDTP